MSITRAKEPSIDKAAASIAKMVDEYTQRGWNDEGRADFAKVIKRRLSRFWPQEGGLLKLRTEQEMYDHFHEYAEKYRREFGGDKCDGRWVQNVAVLAMLDLQTEISEQFFMDHRITEQDVDNALAGTSVQIASSSSAAGNKRLVYHFDRAMFVLTVNNAFKFETTDRADAAKAYSDAR